MSVDAAQLKTQLRRALREQAKRFSAADRAAASAQMCQRLIEQNVWKRAQSVLFYFPMPGEPDIQGVLAAALAAGKATVFPRYSTTDQRYVACQVLDLERDLKPGSFGIPE